MALDFTIIGAQRSGTTWAFATLKMHPKVYFPLGKEVNFWSDYETYRHFNASMIGFYRNRFASRFLTGGEGYRSGDISPQYAVLPEPTIKKLYEFYPQARAIYLLRNPVMRTLSARHFSVKTGKLGEQFAELPALRTLLQDPRMLTHSDYAANLERWNAVAGATGAPTPTVLFYGDLRRDPKRFVRDLCRAVEIDDSFFDLLPPETYSERINASTDFVIPPELYEFALQTYRPLIERLQDVLDLDLAHWLDAQNPSE
jgi:hypothetical protein